MATGDKKRAVMTDDINNGSSSYPVLGPSGDGSDVTAAFTAASTRTNISTGEKLGILFGKIAKWFTDLGDAAFRGVDSTVTASSTNLVESGAVKSAITKVETDIAPTLSDPAGQAVSAEQYFIYDNVLRKALQAISSATTAATFTGNTYSKVVSDGGLNDLVSTLGNLVNVSNESLGASRAPSTYPIGLFIETISSNFLGSAAGTLVTFKATNNRAFQIAMKRDDTTLYFRSASNSLDSWISSWVKVTGTSV